jgi:Zn-dependent peptidase ImmA (M78 family)
VVLISVDTTYNNYMNKEAVIEKAREFVSLYNPAGLVPFPYEATIEKLDNVKLKYYSTDSPDINGAIYLSDGVYNIIINSDKPLNRQYFTVAHELGHYYLHRDELTDEPGSGFVDWKNLDSMSAFLRADTTPGEDKLAEQEKEANTFAAEILMPEDKVREFFEVSGDVEDTAKAFNVSTVAMAIRLEKLGLA